MDEHRCSTLPQPRVEHDPGGLATAVTFFVSRAERAMVLRALRRLSDDRGRALVQAIERLEGGERGR